MPDLYTTLRSQPTQDNLLLDQGDTETAFKQAAVQLHATYYQPYHAHASIGPSCAVADVKEDQITVWAACYQIRGCFPDFTTSFYFSATSYSTVGYGDVLLPERWRILGSVGGYLSSRPGASAVSWMLRGDDH